MPQCYNSSTKLYWNLLLTFTDFGGIHDQTDCTVDISIFEFKWSSHREAVKGKETGKRWKGYSGPKLTNIQFSWYSILDLCTCQDMLNKF